MCLWLLICDVSSMSDYTYGCNLWQCYMLAEVGSTWATRMASVPLQSPVKFNFCNPDEWPKWRKAAASCSVQYGNWKRGVTEQHLVILQEAEDVLTSRNNDRKKYDQVLGKMDEFFKVWKNIIFKRVKFNRRTQQELETAKLYITSMYSLTTDWQYGNLQDEIICNHPIA